MKPAFKLQQQLLSGTQLFAILPGAAKKSPGWLGHMRTQAEQEVDEDTKAGKFPFNCEMYSKTSPISRRCRQVDPPILDKGQKFELYKIL